MSQIKPHLVFYGTDSALLERLRLLSADMPYVSYEGGIGRDVTAKAQLDAIWSGLMAAVELFGLTPPFPLHEAVVLKVPEAQVARGFPKYSVAGVAVSPNDPKTPEYSLRLTLSALLRAIGEFNSRNQEQIARIGILPDDLQLQKLRPETALGIVREAWAELRWADV
jgi:hypothetical protein